MPTIQKTFTYFYIDDKLNDDILDEYCAILENKKKPDCLKLVRCEKSETGKNGLVEVNCIQNKSLQENEISIIPRLSSDEFCQREIIYCMGESESGKSSLLNQYAKYYAMIYPKRMIYYFSTNPMSVSDTSLTHNIFKKINVIDFLEQSETILKEKSDLFKDCLLCVDDIDNLVDKNKKKMWNCIDDWLTNFRKNNTSLFICVHKSCDFRLTRMVLSEMNKYIFFPTLTTQNDRALIHYLNMTKKSIRMLHSLPSSQKKGLPWVCIDKKKEIVITKNQIFSFASIM